MSSPIKKLTLVRETVRSLKVKASIRAGGSDSGPANGSTPADGGPKGSNSAPHSKDSGVVSHPPNSNSAGGDPQFDV